MSDKPVAAFVTFLIVLPAYALCCLGPAAIGSGVVGAIGWSFNSPILTLAAFAVTAALITSQVIKRRRNSVGIGPCLPKDFKGDPVSVFPSGRRSKRLVSRRTDLADDNEDGQQYRLLQKALREPTS